MNWWPSRYMSWVGASMFFHLSWIAPDSHAMDGALAFIAITRRHWHGSRLAPDSRPTRASTSASPQWF